MTRPPVSCFAAWLEHTGMSEAEKAECLLLARQGFGQAAELFLLGGPHTAERFLLRVLGARRARSRGTWQLGSWRFWSCPAGRERWECMNHFLQRHDSSGPKQMIILFAAPGRGGMLRAMQVWRRACAGNASLFREIPVLLVQTGQARGARPCGFRRQENDEWRLQQAAVNCLGRQVPVFTAATGRRVGCSRERLWYQLIKKMNEE